MTMTDKASCVCGASISAEGPNSIDMSRLFFNLHRECKPDILVVGELIELLKKQDQTHCVLIPGGPHQIQHWIPARYVSANTSVDYGERVFIYGDRRPG